MFEGYRMIGTTLKPIDLMISKSVHLLLDLLG